jgi:hypothetical protein
LPVAVIKLWLKEMYFSSSVINYRMAIMWHLWLSHSWLWRALSSGMWCCVNFYQTIWHQITEYVLLHDRDALFQLKVLLTKTLFLEKITKNTSSR